MKNFIRKAAALVAVLGLTLFNGALAVHAQDDEVTEVSVGVYGDIEFGVWEDIAERLESESIALDVQLFTDFVQLNNAVDEGALDMNAVQHMAYLIEVIESSGADLAPIGYTYIQPMAAYSNVVDNLDDLEEGAVIAIPNDPSNGGRALFLLEQAGVIELAPDLNSPTPSDITGNPKNIVVEEVDPGFIPTTLPDVDAVVMNTNVAVDNDLNPYEDGIFVDTNNLEEVNQLYKNIIVVHSDNIDNEVYLKIVDAFQTEETEAKLEEFSDGANQRAWTENDDIAADFAELKALAGIE